MKAICIHFLVCLMLLSTSVVKSQTTETIPRDLFYDEVAVKERQPIPYDHVNENDVYWHKRIWRVIDVREKMNLPFKYEGLDWKNLTPLVHILRNAAIAGEKTVYDEDDFKSPMTADQVRQKGAGFDTVPLQDFEGNYTHDTIVERIFDPNKVLYYRIKEDWFFNKKTSQMQVRIMGIAPMYFDDQLQRSIPLFWVYYPWERDILARNEAFNFKNDAQRWSWEDIFEMRLFTSTIYKESNLFDRRIQDYAAGIDGLRESDRIKGDIFNYEHDLWSF